MFGHASDLPVQTLDQGNAEDVWRLLHDFALFGGGAQHGHALGHGFQGLLRQRLVHGHHVLFFVSVAGPQDLVDDVPVVGQENQPLRVLIEPPNGENAFAVVHKVHNVVRHAGFGGAGDARRFVQRNEHQAVLR